MDDRIANIEQALARLEVRAAHLEEGMTKVLAGQMKQQRTLERALHGTGDSPGLVLRTDRIEQWKARHAKMAVIILGALVPLVAVKVWALVVGTA